MGDKLHPITHIPIMFEKESECRVEDTRFLNVKIYILHTGLNHNGSVFNKDTVESAFESLYNTPILGFITDEDSSEADFSDHHHELRKVNGEYVYEYKGVAIGVIPADCDPHWEWRDDGTGEQREYLVCKGLIWRKWSDPEFIMNRDGVKWQSMELDDTEGSYSGYWKDGAYVFERFKFFGSCILGGEGNLPAMEGSTVEMVNFTLTNFKTEIQNKTEQYKTYMAQKEQNQSGNPVDIEFNKKEGGNGSLNIEERDAILHEFNISLSELDFEIKDETSAEDFRNLVSEFSAKKNAPTEYTSTYQQKLEALSNACDSIIVKDDNGDVVSYTSYCVSDFDDDFVFVVKYFSSNGDDEKSYGRFPYVFDTEGNSASLTGEFEQMTVQWLTKDESSLIDTLRRDFQKLGEEFEQYKTDYSTANTEVDGLVEYKKLKDAEERSEAEATLFERFDETLKANEEYQNIRENSKDFSLEDIENQCLILFAKESLQTKTSTNFSKKQSVAKVPANEPDDKANSPYGDIFN